jgi:hypothetical protein
LRCDNPEARVITKASKNTGNEELGNKLKLINDQLAGAGAEEPEQKEDLDEDEAYASGRRKPLWMMQFVVMPHIATYYEVWQHHPSWACHGRRGPSFLTWTDELQKPTEAILAIMPPVLQEY